MDSYSRRKVGTGDGLGTEEMDKNFSCAMDVMSLGRLLDCYTPLFCFFKSILIFLPLPVF